AAERAASPLYRAEWDRRKVPLSARYTWHADASQDSRTDEWLHFTFIGGIVGPDSDQHFIYTAISDRSSGNQARSVWRLDTGSDGKVIWSELVYLFSEDVTRLTPLLPGRRPPPAARRRGAPGGGRAPAPPPPARGLAGPFPPAPPPRPADGPATPFEPGPRSLPGDRPRGLPPPRYLDLRGAVGPKTPVS